MFLYICHIALTNAVLSNIVSKRLTDIILNHSFCLKFPHLGFFIPVFFFFSFCINQSRPPLKYIQTHKLNSSLYVSRLVIELDGGLSADALQRAL